MSRRTAAGPRPIAQWAVWGSVAAVVYAYVGYPVSVLLRSLCAPRSREHAAEDPVDATGPPPVTLVVAAYNEADMIREHLDSVLAMDYPRERLNVIVASDGSDDGTDEIVEAYARREPSITFVPLPRGGKNAALNAAVPLAGTDLLAFADADTVVSPAALTKLVAPFADPSVGAVSGDYRYQDEIDGATGERAYWNFDRVLKGLQSRGGTMISATGALYAIRREHFRPVPAGVSDDFFVSTQAVLAGQRIVFAPEAIVSGPVTVSDDAEFERKIRVIVRGLRGVWAVRPLLNPLTHGLYTVQLASQKLVRRLLGVPLLVMALTAPFLVRRGRIYVLAVAAQVLVHGLAALGFLFRGRPLGHRRILSFPLYLDMVNAAGIVAAARALRPDHGDVWATERHPDAPDPASLRSET
jgi:GT2 family glycosyltransferase